MLMSATHADMNVEHVIPPFVMFGHPLHWHVATDTDAVAAFAIPDVRRYAPTTAASRDVRRP